jgi:hypothetical protein
MSGGDDMNFTRPFFPCAAAGALALLFSYFCSYPCAAQSALEGDWIGGVDLGSSWQYMNLHFKSANQGVVGTVDFPEQGRMGLALDRIVIETQRVHVEWHGELGLASIDGQLKDGTIAGEFKQGETKATFGLARVANVDPQIYDQYAGSYRLANDRFLYVGVNNANELRFVDSKTGRIGTLYPSSESTFFLGSTVDIPYPIDGTVAFVRDSRGEVSGLLWTENGTRSIPGEKLLHREESVTFRNEEAALSGTLYLPPANGPHPAVVIVNPGYSFPRRNAYFPYFFLQQGFAVLTLNGRSVNGKPADYQHSSFEERARDALPGVRFLKSRMGIDPKHIGLHGASLSAWVVPLASTLSPDVAFIILRVGSAIRPADNIVYEIETICASEISLRMRSPKPLLCAYSLILRSCPIRVGRRSRPRSRARKMKSGLAMRESAGCCRSRCRQMPLL